MAKASDIEDGIARLQEWGRAELMAEWERLYGKIAPVRVSKILMIRAIAYRWQEEIFGGLSKADQKLLERMVAAFKHDPSGLKPSLQMKTGTRMRRLWQGKMHEVTAIQDGFIYEGAKYRSLSEVARTITGTRWNGLVFFGLKQKHTRGADDKVTA